MILGKNSELLVSSYLTQKLSGENSLLKNKIVPQALVVEDDRICQKIYSCWLSELDYGVTISTQVNDAINFINKKAFRLILTDLGLPDKSGIDVIHIARKSYLNKNTLLVVASAHAEEVTRKKCQDKGANAVFMKPLTKASLIYTINQYVSKPR